MESSLGSESTTVTRQASIGRFYHTAHSLDQESRMHQDTKKQGRLTLLAMLNATGTHKLPLLMISTSKKPRCFKNVNMAALHVIYTNQKNVWMDSEIFNHWFHSSFVPANCQHLAQKVFPQNIYVCFSMKSWKHY